MKKMHLTIDVSEDGSVALSADGIQFNRVGESPEAALHDCASIVGAVFPLLSSDPCALSIGPVEAPPSSPHAPIPYTGGEDAKLVVIDAAIADGRLVRFDYTDAHGNDSTRRATPITRGWGGSSDAPRRKMIATHNGVDKTFYLDNISRIELV